jgi:drug/metabolite transporter (DMT)-like permease
MRSRIWVFFVALAGLCWGVYIPFVAEGGKALRSSYASYLCVGVAYFLIAIIGPVAILLIRGRRPAWSTHGIFFATLAGAAGALGALCVILATFAFNGPRIYVGPVIFALAPLINTLVSLFWHPDQGAFRFGPPPEPPHKSLYAGIVMVGIGALLVLLAKELTEASAHVRPTGAAAPPQANPLYLVFVLFAGLCWGTYVPLIAHGGKELKNSYASFLCVGVAYFFIAVLFPLSRSDVREKLHAVVTDASLPMLTGTSFATLAGVAGALGALCVIFATFEFKGPRIYVAPVIFALAPVINTLVSLFWHPSVEAPLAFGPPPELPHWTLYVGIVLAGLGAGTVLYAKELTEAHHARLKAAQKPAPTATPEPAQS